MTTENNDRFALQRLYEAWIKKDEWLLVEEAMPLLCGMDPITVSQQEVKIHYAEIVSCVERAFAAGELELVNHGAAVDVARVRPSVIYNWANLNGIQMPVEFSSLIEFVLKTVLSQQEESREDEQSHKPNYPSESDREKILGACVSILYRYTDQCRGRNGTIRTQRILQLLTENREQLFSGDEPDLSSLAIRDLIDNWGNKLN